MTALRTISNHRARHAASTLGAASSRRSAVADRAPAAGCLGDACRVMVVDDEHTSRVLAEQVIRFLKAQPVVCGSGLEALQVLAEAPVDVICVDLHMPALSGVETVRRIRREEEHLGRRRTPVIALTSSALPEELATCLAQGMDDVMTKPVTIDTLRRVLLAWCDDRGAQARD